MKNRILLVLALISVVIIASCASQDAAVGEFAAQASETYPARYSSFQPEYRVDAQFGDILEAARGTSQDGKKVMALLVRSSQKIDPEGAQQWYESQIPAPYRILIVIDEGTNRVVASRIVRDGTTESVFTVPAEKLDAYKEVIINSETSFDGFKGGLVTGKQFEIEIDEWEVVVIAGTTLNYTGATVQGTYSSQLVRNCYMAAARFYVNSK